MVTLRENIRDLARTVLGQRAFTTIQSIRSRNSQRAFAENNHLLGTAGPLFRELNGSVISGPFAGMRIPEKAMLSRHNVPKLLGTYEKEIARWVEMLCQKTYQSVWDIGCAEGYYAIGLALRMPGTPVTGFDCEPRERALCRAASILNRVSPQIALQPWCSKSALLGLRGRRTLIFSDCEGAEFSLFDSEVIRALARSDLLIEMHPGNHTGNAEDLQQQLAKTHKTSLITSQPRTLDDVPKCAAHLQLPLTPEALSEYRPANQQWLLAEAE